MSFSKLLPIRNVEKVSLYIYTCVNWFTNCRLLVLSKHLFWCSLANRLLYEVCVSTCLSTWLHGSILVTRIPSIMLLFWIRQSITLYVFISVTYLTHPASLPFESLPFTKPTEEAPKVPFTMATWSSL